MKTTMAATALKSLHSKSRKPSVELLLFGRILPAALSVLAPLSGTCGDSPSSRIESVYMSASLLDRSRVFPCRLPVTDNSNGHPGTALSIATVDPALKGTFWGARTRVPRMSTLSRNDVTDALQIEPYTNGSLPGPSVLSSTEALRLPIARCTCLGSYQADERKRPRQESP